jgi:hypothetical protein
VAAAQAMRRSKAALARETVSLARRVAALEAEAETEKKRTALRGFRRSGHLSAGLAKLEADLADIPVEHIRAVLRHVTPSEPRLPGVVLSQGDEPGADADEAPAAIVTADDIERVALRMSKKSGKDFDECRRQIVNSLASPSTRARGNA